MNRYLNQSKIIRITIEIGHLEGGIIAVQIGAFVDNDDADMVELGSIGAEHVKRNHVDIGIPADFREIAQHGLIQNIAVFGYIDAMHLEKSVERIRRIRYCVKQKALFIGLVFVDHGDDEALRDVVIGNHGVKAKLHCTGGREEQKKILQKESFASCATEKGDGGIGYFDDMLGPCGKVSVGRH